VALQGTGKYRLTLTEVLTDDDGDELEEQIVSVRGAGAIIAAWLPLIGAQFDAPAVALPPLPGGPLPAGPAVPEGSLGPEQPKRRRRTKEQIAADNAAAVAGVNQRPDTDIPDEMALAADTDTVTPFNPFNQPQG
jgi:hypothetical protein